jgi:WD40 repeat protein
MYLWDSALDKPVALVEGHSGIVLSLGFSSEGLLVASGSSGYSLQLITLVRYPISTPAIPATRFVELQDSVKSARAVADEDLAV